MKATVFTPGTIRLAAGSYARSGDAVDYTEGGLAHYSPQDAAALHNVVTRHDYVVCPNGKRMAAKSYTLRMASNDLAAAE